MREDLYGLVDLASRRLGAGVVAANDESFAPKENLILPSTPTHSPGTFGHRGQVYDGWETRRRRSPGHDWVIVRLGAPGVVHRVVVDTAHFTGNFPESCWIDGCCADGYPSPEELQAGTDWHPLLGRSPLRGNSRYAFDADARSLVTHVRLSIEPDGGVARLRVLGNVVPDPRRLRGLTVDLAALENGARVEDCSDSYFSVPEQAILPGLAATMGEGWETRRRRGGGNDWLRLRLAAAGHVRQAVVDTTHFLGNAPGWVRLVALDGGATWELLPRTRLQPDTPHWFAIDGTRPATHVRLDAYPDGGLARLRLYGDLAPAGRLALAQRWWNALPAARAKALLAAAGVEPGAAARLTAERPGTIPDPLRPELLG
jgi:allantoicase